MRQRIGIGMLGAAAVLLGCAIGGGDTGTGVATLGDADTTDASSGESTADMPSGTQSGTSEATTSGSTGSTVPDPDTGPGTATETGPMPSCDDDPAACTAWILPDGGAQWIAEGLDTDSALAPTEVVRAAFDIEGENEGVVLTDTRVHVVDLIARQWIRSENRAEALPDLGGDEIVAAYSVPAYWGADPNVEAIIFFSATSVYFFDYQIDTQTFVFSSSMMMFGDSWSEPEAPSPPQVRSSWVDVTNTAGWFAADIMDLCGVEGDPGPYVGVTTSTDVHVTDAGYCFLFTAPEAFGDFVPFGLPGAPQPTDVGATLYSETAGLWVFRGE